MKILNLIILCILFLSSYSAYSEGEDSSSVVRDTEQVCCEEGTDCNEVRTDQVTVRERERALGDVGDTVQSLPN